MTTSTINNGTTKTKNKKKREEKRQREQQNVDTRDGSGVTDNNPQTGPDKRDTDYARSPDGQKNGQSFPSENTTDTTDTTDTTKERIHGPYTTEEEAKANPVTYGSKSKKAGETLALFAVSLAGHPVQYWFGMNYHHAAIQYLKAIGGTVEQCGNGKSKAIAIANTRASEAEMRAAAAEQARIDMENAAQSQFAQLVALCRTVPQALATIEPGLRARIEAALAS